MELRWKIAQWFELWWWKFYLSGKNKSAYLTWKKAYWQSFLSNIPEIVNENNPVNAIDLGCGPAGIFIALPSFSFVAVDPLLNKYEEGSGILTRSDYPNTLFIASRIEDFETEKKFSLVCCLNAINHVHDINKGFDRLKELLDEHGRIVLSVDAHKFPWLKKVFKFLPIDILHPHQYDLGDYNLFFEKRGLKILKTVRIKREVMFDYFLLVAG